MQNLEQYQNEGLGIILCGHTLAQLRDNARLERNTKPTRAQKKAIKAFRANRKNKRLF